MRNCQLASEVLIPTFLFFFISSYIFAGESPGAPLVGRKEPFCGAIGSGRFKVTTTANPTKLQAGDSFVFSIRIQAAGHWLCAPERPDLKQKPEYSKFRDRFFVEYARERLSPDQGTWEFDYSLRPKNERVKEVPSLVIVYFRPGLTPSEKGYMTTIAPAIPLRVTSRAKVDVKEIQGASELKRHPDRLYEITAGSQVLESDRKFHLDNWLLLLLVIGPPALSIGWCVWYTQQNPDASRRRRLQKSWAARQALRALEGVNGRDHKEEASRVAQLFANYLRHRFDMTIVQSSPRQPALLVDKLPMELMTRVAEFFRTCDEIRYAPPPFSDMENPKEKAIHLILDLELRP